jgi:hypothetical protein
MASALVAGGCGGKDHSLPAACRAGTGAIISALSTAPGAVTLDGVPISRCFQDAFQQDDVEYIGGTMVAVAAELSPRALARRESPAALQLGYLIGAAHRGKSRNPGLVDELVRRLDQESGGLERSRAYKRGVQAGRSGG